MLMSCNFCSAPTYPSTGLLVVHAAYSVDGSKGNGTVQVFRSLLLRCLCLGKLCGKAAAVAEYFDLLAGRNERSFEFDIANANVQVFQSCVDWKRHLLCFE